MQLSPIPFALTYRIEGDGLVLGNAGTCVFWNDACLLGTPSTLLWKRLYVAYRIRLRCVEKTRLVLLAGGLSSNEQNGQVWIGDTEFTGKYALQRMLKGVF